MPTATTTVIAIVFSEPMLIARVAAVVTGDGVVNGSVGFSCIAVINIGTVAVHGALAVVASLPSIGGAQVDEPQFNRNFGMNVFNFHLL